MIQLEDTGIVKFLSTEILIKNKILWILVTIIFCCCKIELIQNKGEYEWEDY